MRRLLAILAASLWGCTAGAAQSTKDEVHFRATVQDVGLLPPFPVLHRGLSSLLPSTVQRCFLGRKGRPPRVRVTIFW